MTTPDTIEQIQQHAEEIIALAESLKPPAAVPISTPTDFDTALAAASPGATLTLAKTLVYPRPLDLPKPVTLQSETYSANQTTRMTRDEPAPTFMGGITALYDNHALLGLALRGTDTIGVLGGLGGVWDRCRVLGDPVQGAHRGVEWRGGRSFIRRCFMDDIFRRDQDTQAICAWDCEAPGLVVDDCYLSAAGQSIMFGGADSTAAEHIPRSIHISKSAFAKKASWLGVQQVKCAFEIKCAIDVTVEFCDMQHGGMSQGQGCYLMDMTVRNQDGAAPWSCITNIEIAHCTGELASGVCNILGEDNVHPSGKLDGLHIHDCQFTAMDGHLGSGRLFLFGGSPAHVTLLNQTISGVNMASLGYFYGILPPTGFVAGGLTLPSSEYGWYLDADTGHAGSGRTKMLAYMPDAQLDQTIQ